MSEIAYLFSQQHSLVLQEIASHLPTKVLQNLITAVKPSFQLKTILLDVMYDRMKETEKKYIFRFPAPGPHTPKPVICYTRLLPLDLHLLSDMNLCRIRWLIDLMFLRKQIPELKDLMQYMENDSEDCESYTLTLLKYYVFSKYDYCSDLETMRFDEVKRRAVAPHFSRQFYSF